MVVGEAFWGRAAPGVGSGEVRVGLKILRFVACGRGERMCLSVYLSNCLSVAT